MIWLEQDHAPETTRSFDLADRGLLLGDGVFDTSLVTNGRVMLREAHLDRLCRDAAALDIKVVREQIDEVVNQLTAQKPSGALRVTLTRGPGGRGLAGQGRPTPTVLARLKPYDTARIHAPVALVVSDLTRNPGSLTARHKTLSYTDNIMAVRRAVADGADDALFLNSDGNIACTGSANILARYGTSVKTPPVADGALPGTIRQFVLSHAKNAGLQAIEQTLSFEDLEHADQIFITNSLRLIAPVSRLGTRVFDTSPLSAMNALLNTERTGQK